jgi:L-rhamnose-H+ transport protein
MLIFFSYIVGVIMKEWTGVRRGTYAALVVALVLLVVSFIITSYGSYYGEQMVQGGA